MTVNLGFGAQALIPAVVHKVARVKRMIGERNIRSEIDGGVTAFGNYRAARLMRAGANVLVRRLMAVFKS